MIPTSFAPMILKLILGKKILPKLMESIGTHMAKVYKLKEVVNYMELPNNADLLGKENKEQIDMLAGEWSMLDNRLKKLEILFGKAKKIKKSNKNG